MLAGANTGRRMLATLLLLLSVRDAPLNLVAITHRSFLRLSSAADEYARHMQRVGPVYDSTVPPGPPFDMYHHLEVIDRLLPNLTAVLQQMQHEWEFLYPE